MRSRPVQTRRRVQVEEAISTRNCVIPKGHGNIFTRVYVGIRSTAQLVDFRKQPRNCHYRSTSYRGSQVSSVPTYAWFPVLDPSFMLVSLNRPPEELSKRNYMSAPEH
jgi:hypothetical protein